MFGIFVPILFYGALIWLILSKAKKNKTEGKTTYGKKTTYNVVSDYNKKKPDVNRYKKAVKRKAQEDDEYDSVSMAYCESTITPSKGITFHGLKAGVDELEILEKRNASRERELERALHSEHSHE